ncbi:MAG: LytTR family DNA-binding domain-containing protein [Bacteroidota bacterium]
MKHLTAIIIDDEQNGREILSTLLRQHVPNLTVLDALPSAAEGAKAIRKHDPDIVFLDVEMPTGSGFTLFETESIRDRQFHVIFTTAYEQYAIKAIKYAALDYLLKPIDLDELQQAVEKVRAKSPDESESAANLLQKLQSAIQQEGRLKLVSREGFEMVSIQRILYCKSEANYTRFYLEDGSNRLVSKTMKLYQAQLEAHNFLRIHKSHMVNLSKIVRYLQGKGGQVILENGATLDVSKDKKSKLIAALGG